MKKNLMNKYQIITREINGVVASKTPNDIEGKTTDELYAEIDNIMYEPLTGIAPSFTYEQLIRIRNDE
jgi:archaellum component FlaC